MNYRLRKLALWMHSIFLFSITSSFASDFVVEQQDLAKQFAACAAYYLMISQADPKLNKLARVGAVAADNARLLSDSDRTLSMMALETRRMLAKMNNDWGNAGIVIADKATSCKVLMTAN